MQGKRIVRYSFFAWLLVLLAACSTTAQQSTNQSSSSQQVSTENIKSGYKRNQYCKKCNFAHFSGNQSWYNCRKRIVGSYGG